MTNKITKKEKKEIVFSYNKLPIEIIITKESDSNAMISFEIKRDFLTIEELEMMISMLSEAKKEAQSI